jgi:two-component system invasion response regulator UvrY
MQVLISGSQKLLRVGLKCILTRHFGGRVEVHQSSDESCVAVCRDLKPDIVLVDVDISIGSGIELAARLVEDPSKPIVIAITSRSEPTFLSHLMETEASGFLSKSRGEKELLKAVDLTVKGKTYVSEPIARLLAHGRVQSPSTSGIGSLALREMEVLIMLAQGISPIEIAERLSISPETVASYKQRIHDKLGTRNTADITRIAVKSGLLTGI